MWWKRNSVEKQTDSGASLPKRVSTGINQYVSGKEQKVATFLNRKAEGLSTKGKKWFLAIFCLVFGGISFYLVIHTAISKSSRSAAIEPSAISVPQHMNKTGEENLYPGVLVTEEDMKQVRVFKLHMDSLRLSTSGRAMYDSILKARPGLMDTVSMLEQLYLLQQKK